MTTRTSPAAGSSPVNSAFLHSALMIAAALAAAVVAQAQDVKEPYPSMAPLDQYLMERAAEMALAQSAAPDSISQNAEVLVLVRHGYESAAKGTNGFVCLAQRSWAAGPDDPEFWNPKLRAPICLNPPAVRSYLPQITKTTDWVLAGRSSSQVRDDIRSAVATKLWPTPEIGAMCYMMSKLGYLNDRDGHWYPHLMFFLPPADPATWGANLPGSPVLGSRDATGGVTVFFVPVDRWSDGSSAPEHVH